MKNFKKIQTQLSTLNLDEIRTQIETGELTHINISYNPETKDLSIYGATNPSQSDVRLIREVKIDIDTYAALIVGVVNDPVFITSNTEKPANVDVEFGAFR